MKYKLKAIRERHDLECGYAEQDRAGDIAHSDRGELLKMVDELQNDRNVWDQEARISGLLIENAKLEAQLEKVRGAAYEALEWNWLDDDAPESERKKIMQTLKESK